MKKTNKKGFTLIELLAVIIILGVIMLIAIPSVTQQITNSRKNSYSDTLQSYIKAVVTEVNEGTIPMYDANAIYAIPVGNDSDRSCVDLESGGASPFNKKFKYGYVFARYTGSSYNYWIEMVDGSNQGVLTTESKQLEKAGSKYIHPNITANKIFVTAYGDSSFASEGDSLVEAKTTGDSPVDMITLSAYKDYFNHIIAASAISDTVSTDTAGDAGYRTSTWTSEVVPGNWTSAQAATHVFFVKPDACRE